MKAAEKANKPQANEAKAAPFVVVFGMDEAGKPHASWFGAAESELAEKAAGFMRFKVLRLSTDDHRAIASQLPAGRIFSSGKGFVPFVKRPLYEALSAFEGHFEPPVPIEAQPEPMPAAANVPTKWDDVGVGSLVLASTGPREGWFESVVVEVKGDSLFVLRWLDWPSDPSFVRRVDGVALLPQNLAKVPTDVSENASSQPTS
jgi:hypothetical protein